MKVLKFEAVAKRAKHDHNFCREVAEAGQANGGKCTQAKGECGRRHTLSQSPQVAELQRSYAFTELTGDGKEKGNGDTVRKHQNGRSVQTKKIRSGDSEKD